jgi:hypothetical protein
MNDTAMNSSNSAENDAGKTAAIQAATTASATLSLLATATILLLPLLARGPTNTMQYVIVAVLAAFNFVEAATFVIGPALVPSEGAQPSGACVLQGVVMQFASMGSFSWVLVFCHALYSTARGGTGDLLGAMPTWRRVLPSLLAACFASLVSCCALIGEYGGATLWCWVDSEKAGLFFYYLPLVVIWLLALACVLFACAMVRSRVNVAKREVQHRAASGTARSSTPRLSLDPAIEAPKEVVSPSDLDIVTAPAPIPPRPRRLRSSARLETTRRRAEQQVQQVSSRRLATRPLLRRRCPSRQARTYSRSVAGVHASAHGAQHTALSTRLAPLTASVAARALGSAALTRRAPRHCSADSVYARRAASNTAAR